MPWTSSTRRARLPKNWSALVHIVKVRDRHCQHPGCSGPPDEVDHIKRGDDHTLTNLQALCRDHHKQKTSRESQQARGVGALRKRPTEPNPGLATPGG